MLPDVSEADLLEWLLPFTVLFLLAGLDCATGTSGRNSFSDPIVAVLLVFVINWRYGEGAAAAYSGLPALCAFALACLLEYNVQGWAATRLFMGQRT